MDTCPKCGCFFDEMDDLCPGCMAPKTGSIAAEVAREGNQALVKLLTVFDEALNQNPFLWFELGYTRPTDWMVHVWDRRGGKNEKIITEQNPDRNMACHLAARKLRALYGLGLPLRRP